MHNGYYYSFIFTIVDMLGNTDGAFVDTFMSSATTFSFSDNTDSVRIN